MPDPLTDGPSRRDEDPAQGANGPDDPLQDEAAGWRPLPAGSDWMDDEQWAASLAARESEDEPADPDLGPDPEDPPLPGEVDMAAIIAECREITADEAGAATLAARLGTTGALAAVAATLGRRGPGLPGSARTYPGEYPGPAGAFATGMALDTAPGCAVLMSFADQAAGDDDAYRGACDDELVGALCAWDRVEAHSAARKHAAVAELIRRRPAPGCALEGPARMPAAWDEFAPDELSFALAESRGGAENLLDLAWDLEVNLPGTRAAFRDGILRVGKARIIADATQTLTPEEARAAEALVLDRAGRLTPGGLRSAIARAVMQVAPDKARKRREEAARDARVERWAEDSGNAALVGRELPPAEVLAADQRISWWARQLKNAGLDGSMDELRARAYLDILLDKDSRPGPAAARGTDSQPGPDGTARGTDSQPGPDGTARGTDSQPGPDGTARGTDSQPGPDGTASGGQDGPDDPQGGAAGGRGDGGSGPPGPGGPDGPPLAGGPRIGGVPAGFAGRVTVTIPLATLLDLADRPGEIPGIGPIDPALARNLARAAARHPGSTWCVTLTDQDGHAIGHGCARPGPARPAANTARRRQLGSPGGHDPPGRTAEGGGAGFAFMAASPHGPPGGYGTWRLSTGIPGQPDLIIALEPIAVDQCDHRYEARGHDPGVKLRHLSQVRHATCSGPTCRRPASHCDFEHNIPYEVGGRTCMCNGGPKCRHHHRLKQEPRWKVEQPAPAVIRWTTPSGRQYTTEPTRYPI